MTYFCITDQECICIVLNNFNSPILANFALLCSRSLIVHNLHKKRIPLDLLLNNVLLRNESSMYLHYPERLQLSILANFFLLCFRSLIVHNLDKKGTLLNLLLNNVLLHNGSNIYLHYPKQLQPSHLGQFCSIMLPITNCTQLAQKTDSSRSDAQLCTFVQRNKYVFALP